MDGYDGDGLDRALGSFSIFIMIWAFFIIKRERERERGWK
jgi:hypothetical protein